MSVGSSAQGSAVGELSDRTLEPLWDDGELVLSRSIGRDEAAPVLVVAPARTAPATETFARLERALALRELMDPTCTARPLALAHDQLGRPLLLLEDPGGEVLARLVGSPWDLTVFLRVAIGLAGALRRLHARGLVHRDLKPANVLVNAATGDVWLTGFRMAFRVPRELQAPDPPRTIAGTLAYMAPEQTGRMHRSIDARSDLYALGATLYEMLSGSVPFTATDPIELMHCHVARQPEAPAARGTIIPEPIAALVLKLLAKAPEDRFQTAAGVEADLRHALAAWESAASIPPFPLGSHDVPDQIRAPEKLYGRAAEIAELLATFDGVVADGMPTLVLVSGYSGIGKSSVVHEWHTRVAPRCRFASGKVDQDKRDAPYATLAQVLRSLVRPLLAHDEADLTRWRDAISDAVQPSGQLVVNLASELELIIGRQPPVPELPQPEAQRRFHGVIGRLLAVFARQEQPLALFLDDIQWLDAATLDLLEHFVTHADLRHLLVIGAYRSNEVVPLHALRRLVQRVQLGGTRVREVALGPLGLDDVGQLVADAVHGQRDRTGPLAELVHEKTAGNPFFVHQFLSTLAGEGWLAFDAPAGAWTWDLEGIRAKGYTDNVVDLVVGKLSSMPVATQEALRELACLGNRSSLATLRLVRASSDAAIHQALSEAVRTGLVVPLEDGYAFPHDRIQEAAYALIPERERAAAHLRIGRALAAGVQAPEYEEAIFEVVDQLNRGHALLTSDEERERVAELNLVAGKRARTATAYDSALIYFVAGGELLGADSWRRCYALAFGLELHRAECEFLVGDLGRAEERLDRLAARAATLVDGAAVTCLRMGVYMVLDLYNRALEVGCEFLRTAGIEWSLHPTDDDVRREYERMWATMAGRPIEALVDLPAMTEPERRAAMDVLVLLLEPSLYAERNQFALALGRMVNLSLEHGNSDGSSLAYAQLIMVLGPRFGDYQSGFRFGQLGLDLVEHRRLDRYRARVYLVVGHHVLPWIRALDAGRALVERAFETAQHTGDLTFAAYSGTLLVTNLLASGATLDRVQRVAESHLAFARTAGFNGVIHALDTQIDLIRVLRGTATAPALRAAVEANVGRAEQDAMTTWWGWVRTLQASFHFGDFAGALDATARAGTFTWTRSTFFEVAEWHFYAALTHAASHDAASADQRPRHRAELLAHYEAIVQSAQHCPATFGNRAALVSAEIARLDGRELEAEHLYEEAIRLAREHGFAHNEGVANERAAGFHAARGFQTIADAYLRNARYCYLQWGADGKVRQLGQRYPHLHASSTPVDAASVIGAPVEQLELATVVRASQAVSGEIVLEKLIHTLMLTALEHAGAERGLLILPRGDGQRIEAEATILANAVTVQLRDAAVTSMELPESVLRFVIRTQERVLLDDAAAHEAFASDPYVRRSHARSILCLPLLKQAKLAGVLYLENNLAPAVFTAARIALLELLASQAAISLENAHLYEDLRHAEQTVRRHEQELRLTIDAIPEIVWTAQPDGTVDSFNQRMLDFVGATATEAGTMRWDALVHPEDFPAIMEQWSASLRSGEANQTEFRARRHDGEYRWFMVRALPLRDETGAVVRWFGASIDIQDRKEAEVTIRAQEAELRMLVDLVPHHILVVDAEFRLLRANLSGLDYLGLSFDELSRFGGFDYYHPDDLDTLRAAFESLARGSVQDYEVRARRHDGQYRWHLFRVVPLRDEHGTVIRWYITATDIEDRKRTEERVLEENLALREEVDKVSMFEEIVGTAGPLRTVLANVSRVAPTDSTVLITGETGTGKELVARAIHKQSRRSSRAFISVNCAAIPPTLIASELFGHEKGAFTGAMQRRLGRFELADGGTIFLDEIGDLPADAQLALLRVLQERTFERVGGTRSIVVDVRVIAATNRDLEAAMADGRFRSDLFYRLNVFPIEVPPLRERKEDIPLLVAYFVDRYAGKTGKPIRTLDKRTLDLLQAYPWPGNIRELQNVVERSVIVCETETFVVDESWLSREAIQTRLPATAPLAAELGARERQMIETALAATKGRVSGATGAAARLGMPGSTLESRIKALGIVKSRFKPV